MLGPFGGGVVAAILTELGTGFGVSPAAASSSLTAYLLPFALLMLVSGTIGERWGANRCIRLAYLLFLAASLLSAAAPWFWLFQLGRGLQGAANAFTTPLLLAGLATITPKARLGRALGLFGAMQALGQTSAPLLGGLAAEVNWRWAFVGPAVVAAVLAACPLPPDRSPASAEPARLRAAWRWAVLRPGLIALAGWACLAGLSFLVAFRLEDAFAASSGPRGLVLTGYGVAGFLTARLVGGLADRFGAATSTLLGLAGGALVLAAIGLVDSFPLIAVAWALAGICAQLIIVGVNATVLADGPHGRGGAISVVQALRFLGMAAAPAAFTGIYHQSAALGFLLPAGLLLLAILLLRPSRAPA